MDQDNLIRQLAELGVLLMLDSPTDLQIGIDNISWKIGSKFKGIKLIPLGTHIITYSRRCEKNMFPTHLFINFSSQQRIHVLRWNSKQEKFAKVIGEQCEGLQQGVRSFHFDAFLGPYPQQNQQFWKTNSHFITNQVLSKLSPKEYYSNPKMQYDQKGQLEQDIEKLNIDSDEDDEGDGGDEPVITEIQEKQLQDADEKGENSKKGVQKGKDFGGNIYYSEIPRRLKAEGSHTNLVNIDKTQILNQVLLKEWAANQMNILGQIQYSFLSFLIGQSLDSYTQWKQLIILLAHSEKAFKTRKQLMQEFIVVLYEQLRQFPQDFFYDELGKDNFLCDCFLRLRQYVRQGQIGKKTISRIKKLLDMIKQRFNYEAEESMEDQPIIVEENESYF